MSYAKMLAARIHHEWQKARGADLEGKKQYNPRIKVVAGIEYDIANLDYDDLPEQFRYENFESAKSAEDALNLGMKKGLRAEDLLEFSSDEVHEAWLSRNASWAPAEQNVPYSQLSEMEKDKDRLIVRLMAELMGITL
jgi:hypothetical protein